MRNATRNLLLALSAFVYLLLTACGGGGGNQVSGIDGSGAPISSATLTVSSGAINGFGSVIVNGVEYNSDKAKILINDQTSNENNLHIGYQVKLTGLVNSDGTATADSIEFRPTVQGTITFIDLTTQSFTVLNQKIMVNNATVFDPAITPNYLDGLKIGDSVLVSGTIDDKSIITATRIERTNASSHQASGIVSNLNQTNFTFTLNSLLVNYSSASLSNFTNNTISNAVMVNVVGTVDSNGILQAQTVTRTNNSFDKTIKNAELEGTVTRFVSSTDFDVAGISCTTNSQTTFNNGSTTNIALGVALSLNGNVNSSGVVVAQKIDFKSNPNNAVAGNVSTITLSTTTGVITGSLQINGTTIQTNAKTAFEDDSNAQLKRFNLSNISTGDFLKISGFTQQGVFVAIKIERENIQENNNTELKYNGIITSVGSHSFILYGQTITTNSSTEIDGLNGAKLTETQFYTQAVGQRVKVEGVLNAGIFTATKIEFDSNSED